MWALPYRREPPRMVEQELLNKAIEAGGLTVAVICLTMTARWLIQLCRNHMEHWTEESRLTRAAYDRMIEAMTEMRNWCQYRAGAQSQGRGRPDDGPS